MAMSTTQTVQLIMAIIFLSTAAYLTADVNHVKIKIVTLSFKS